MATFTWIVAALALVGVWLNIRKRVACFWVWSLTNAAWVVIDVAHGVYAQAALQAAYFALSIWGIHAWSRSAKRENTSGKTTAA